MCLYITVYACDVCGCGAAGQGLGMLPQFYKHFIGLQYQHRSYSSIHSGLLENSRQASYDEYTTTQLWGRFQPTERLQLFAFVPYQYNRQSQAGSTTIQSGIGDITILANVVAIKKTDDNGNATLLLAGGGLKLPTGRHNGSLPNNIGLPEAQPGTGSWDFLANTNYTIKRKNIGINAEATYIFTTANKDAYKYGNRLSSAVRVFYAKQLGSFMLLPQLGGKYEYALHDYDNYDRKWLNEGTGGQVFYGTAAVQAFYKKVGMQVGYNYPLVQQYASGNVTIKPQFDTGIFLLF